MATPFEIWLEDVLSQIDTTTHEIPPERILQHFYREGWPRREVIRVIQWYYAKKRVNPWDLKKLKLWPRGNG